MSARVCCKSMCLGNLFSEERQLHIPPYQRGYCWGEGQIKPFLEALWNAAWNKEYHLGTIIVHCHDGKMDIVDGLQRLLTLAMLESCLKENTPQILGLLQTETDDLDMLRAVHLAYGSIQNWQAANPIDTMELKKFLAEKVSITLVEIQEELDAQEKNLPLAWTFFDAINSGGKRLSDYDLLKAFHLRYLTGTGNAEDELKAFKAQKWDEMGQKGDFADTLGYTFYLCRQWQRGRDVQVNKMPADARYTILNHYRALEAFTQVNCTGADLMSGLAGGKFFFDWAEKFIGIYKQFRSLEAIEKFYKVPWKPEQWHLLNIIQAVVFFYYCRFGEAYLSDALIFTSYRLAILRNNRLNLLRWYNEGRVKHTVEAIDESPTPEFYFHYCRMPSNRYAIQYDLKTTTLKDELMKSQRHGPNFWRYLLYFASSNGCDYSIGRTICFKKEVQELLQYVAKAFKQELDEDLFLK